MKLVVALGGNALIRRGERADIDVQRRNVSVAADAVAELARRHDVVVTHGNGPQVGLLALQTEAYTAVPPYPLDVLGAESDGMVGYLLEQGLRNRLHGREVATLLTEVVVDPGDPALARPTKPIGPVYDSATAQRLAAERGWTVAPEAGGARRVVGSPAPVDVLGLASIRQLAAAGTLVVCAGGGGIPVARDVDGTLRGVEAVIDKDLASALLAERLGADMLLLLTDVTAVQQGWGTPAAAPIGRIAPAALRALRFPPGSMGPKVEAACRFAEATGRSAAIGALGDAAAIVAGSAGTVVAG